MLHAIPVIDLATAEAMRDFACHVRQSDFTGIIEDEVKAAVKYALEQRGYEAIVRRSPTTAVMIETTSASGRIVLVVKGEGSHKQTLANCLAEAIGQVVFRMADPDTSYGIGLPAQPGYVELILKIPKRVSDALRLDFYLVRRRGSGYEIGVFRPTR